MTIDRLRSPHLERPFQGVRMQRTPADPSLHPLEAQRWNQLALIRALSQRLTPGQFFSHSSAAVLWGAPLPPRSMRELHVSAHSPGRAPRITDVIGHRVAPGRCPVREVDGVRVAAPATTWAMLGSLGLSVPELVAAGDQLVRMYRPGYGRREVGKAPTTTREELAAVLELGRWVGSLSLHRAVELVREDSWSPQESFLRVNLVNRGLPEPELNRDIYSANGDFLGCLDLSYPEYRLGVEYHGVMHSESYSRDVERMAAFRSEKWEIIEVTSALGAQSITVAARVEEALRARGWSPR
ncbi:hypothetical protein GCM10027033_05450 [Leucobacter ruminantium]